MKAQFLALVSVFALFASVNQANADVFAPKGCRFEVQVKYVGAIHHPRGALRYSYWERYGASYESLNKAKDMYNLLAAADDVDKLDELLGLSNSSRKFPVGVRLVFICETSNPFKSEDLTVMDSTEGLRE